MQHSIFYSFLGALLPILVYLLFIRWMDRYEKEPLGHFMLVFLYGALISFLLSYFGNSFIGSLSQPFLTYEGHDFLVASFIAPLIEEFNKGLILVGLLYLSRSFNTMSDGMIYGATVGLGFAFTENLIHFERVYANAGIFEWIYTIYLRGFFLAGVHASASALFGAGCGYARSKKGSVRIVFLCVGYCLAVMTHSFWNSFVTVAELARDNILGFVPYLAIPCLFFLLFILFEIAVMEEREKIRKQLTLESLRENTLPIDHVPFLASFLKRSYSNWLPKKVNKALYLRKTAELAFHLDDFEKGIGSSEDVRNEISQLREDIKKILNQKGSVVKSVVIALSLVGFFSAAALLGTFEWRRHLIEFPAYDRALVFIENHPLIQEKIGTITQWDRWPRGRFWYNHESGSGYLSIDIAGENGRGQVKLNLENEQDRAWAVSSASLIISGQPPQNIPVPLSYKEDAQFYIAQNNFDKAIEVCHLLDKLAANDYLTTDCWGSVFLARQDYKSYVDLYLRQRDDDPEYYLYQLKYGQSLMDVGRDEEAIEPLFKAWDLKPGADVANELAAAYLNTNHLKEALDFLEQAKSFGANDLEHIIQFNYGIYYHLQKQYELAISYFEQTLKLKPDYYRAYIMLADCYYFLNNSDKVIFYMEQGLNRSPWMEEDRKYLVEYLLSNGRNYEAIYHAIRFGDHSANKDESDAILSKTIEAARK